SHVRARSSRRSPGVAGVRHPVRDVANEERVDLAGRERFPADVRLEAEELLVLLALWQRDDRDGLTGLERIGRVVDRRLPVDRLRAVDGDCRRAVRNELELNLRGRTGRVVERRLDLHDEVKRLAGSDVPIDVERDDVTDVAHARADADFLSESESASLVELHVSVSVIP